MSGNPVERFYRDAKIMEIIEGTSQMHELQIARNFRL
ncbi:acyl-CoA dehydrogenase family protein [Paenibacillus rhizoplanae]